MYLRKAYIEYMYVCVYAMHMKNLISFKGVRGSEFA